MANIITIAGKKVHPGECRIIEIPASLYTQTPINIPVHVRRGKQSGPCIFLTAAIHGDEINGTEIIRLLLRDPSLKHLNGTLIAIPVVNVYGFVTRSRYLPDRRDLNRSFPGSATGSLAARLAHTLTTEIIQQCTHGIDLHTGNIQTENLPHIRVNFDVPGAIDMARAFNVPVILNSKVKDGSIRQAATELNVPLILYEAGEALRFNELAIQVGLRGVLNVMHSLGMLPHLSKQKKVKSEISASSGWLRSPKSGIMHPLKHLGTYVKKNEVLGVIVEPFAGKETKIKSPTNGVIIGKNCLPLVNEGDALFHLAQLNGGKVASSQFTEMHNDLIDNPIAIF